ncbi:MAG TPA: sigma-70 family RNA polymerase sigma factor [Opitutaceae bacterium]|nr:sigma-70 family RNA polymerase sigma factor [Opitutaceae bacterium]
MTFLPPLSAEQECSLNQARRAGDAQAREQLILSNLRLVWHLVKRYTWGGIGADDLFSSGIVGLIAAVDTFDHDRGRLVAHARMHIRKEMLGLIAAQRSLLRLPSSVNYHALLIARAESSLTVRLGREPSEIEVSQATGLSPNRLRTIRQALGAVVSLDDDGDDSENGTNLHESLADEDAETGHEVASASSRLEWLTRALHRLSPREQKLLRRHFGLDGHGGQPLAQVSTEMNISRERLRQVELTALRKLRNLLQADGAHLGESFGHSGWDQLLREAGLRLAEAA